ncbi:MAG: hypothetical protein BWY20_02333 [Spirochaetes bacterium ADurb.Bin215]|nr:MAG: hypothetical protein BWY20_02333 [Spirochaetes bacterium ADurb.Bin215]
MLGCGSFYDASDRGNNLELGGSFVNVGDPRVAVMAFNVELLHVPGSAVNLDALVGHFVTHFSVVRLYGRSQQGGKTGCFFVLVLHFAGPRFVVVVDVLKMVFDIDDTAGVVHKGAAGFDLDAHVGEKFRNGDELADRLAELDALFRVLVRFGISRFGNAEGLGGDAEACTVHEGHDVFEKTHPPLSAEFRRSVVELDFASWRSVYAELVLDTADLHAGFPFVDEHGKSAGVG